MPMEMFPALKHHTRAADQTDSSLQLQTIGRLFQSFSSRITDEDTIKYDLDITLNALLFVVLRI